ncbi:Aste57867_8317 [Aphanomyces stellatus]|uniref:Aste57867_8317 protein n=1 Tax=Aphanomyces stellatus TaxID=120398 RepID=A0A485KJX2_9STRA|nr:hypothetical protein As57867_008285 [Aphanomyces stellatus]VFT85204.1 Aste57867_8317 [Aphanomyces stellatus]
MVATANADANGTTSNDAALVKMKPMPTWLFLCTCLYSAVATCVRRLFGFKPPVEGWTIMQEFGVEYIGRTVMTPYEDLRRNVGFFMAIANYLLLPVPLVPIEEKGFRGLWYGATAAADADATVLYIHGGGFVSCTATTYAMGIVDIQKALKQAGKTVRVLALEYSLAPEAKFPTQGNQAFAAYEYLVQESSKPVILLGDSAGGNLVLSLLLTLKAQAEAKNLRSPLAAVLVSPWVQLDLQAPAASFTAYCNSDIVKLPALYNNVHDYIDGTTATVTNPLVNPILGDFRGCSIPVFIHYGGKEVLRDDIEAMAKVLTDQGVHVATMMEPLAPHISPLLPTFFGDMATSGTQAIATYLAMVIG